MDPAAIAADADLELRLQSLHTTLVGLFGRHRPSAAVLETVAHVAQLAHARVAAERQGVALPADAAECGALWGYQLGYWTARDELARREAREAAG